MNWNKLLAIKYEYLVTMVVIQKCGSLVETIVTKNTQPKQRYVVHSKKIEIVFFIPMA